MKRGEIYFADLNPTMGSEINKKRPVLIVSNDANNKYSETITILPITSNVKKIYPFEVFLSYKECGLEKDSKAQAQQIRTISVGRIKGKALSFLTSDKMMAINNAIKLHLDLK